MARGSIERVKGGQGKPVGVWLIGARGTLATTVVVGARALARGLTGRSGLVTDLPDLRTLPLVGPDQLVFGGWDVAATGLLQRAKALASEDRALPMDLVTALEEDLKAAEGRIRPGFPSKASGRREPLTAVVERLGEDLDRFRSQHRLESLIVVNLASTEAPVPPRAEYARLESFRQLIRKDQRTAVPPSLLYAYVALERGYPYLNFTPSPGIGLPALQELGGKHHVPFYGSDGKTGETLLKTVLAPLFRLRNLEVLSWEGFNILGGGDGRVLDDPRHKRSKLRSKSGVLASALGYQPHSGVFIEYVPSLGNWKTAWDFIQFRGFLGTKMSLQFIWQGCDAILAAPLVIDLIRLTEFAQRKGEAGPMTHLACFFKDPLGVSVHSFVDQFRLLLDYAERHRARPAKKAASPRPSR